MEYTIALFVSPGGGMFVFWPAASFLLATACLLPLVFRPGRDLDMRPALVLISVKSSRSSSPFLFRTSATCGKPEATGEFFQAKTPPSDAPWRGGVAEFHACQHEQMWFGRPMPLYALQGVGTTGGALTSIALESELDAIASETAFSGVVRVDRADRIEVARAYGLAHRGYEIPNEVDTQFAIASGTKGLTALTVVSLIEDGRLDLSTTARSVLGPDLPLIGDDVTIEHLLSHRSGIGDYLDEEAGLELTNYLMPVPVHELATTEQYVAVLDGHPRKFAPGERFGYCNGGYVVLALIAERASGMPFHDVVRRRVCEPAGMGDTEFLRSDELPKRAALGYLAIDGVWRTNVFHLPVRGNGDGGIYSTVADISSLWKALFAGQIVSMNWVSEMVRGRSDVPSESMRYGLGFWLHASTDTVMLEGCDAGVSFRTVHDPHSSITHTVISNTSDGAWPIARYLDERLVA